MKTRSPHSSSFQILLIQPPIEDFYTTDCRIQPIGLGYLAAGLRKRITNIDIRIHDALAGGQKRPLPWPEEFQYLQPYYGYPQKGPFKLFHHYYRFGQSDEQIEDSLKGFSPSLIGISCLFSPYYRQSLSTARICRKLFGDVKIVMGGNHATMHPQTIFQPPPPFNRNENLCDFIIAGEAEDAICELTENLLGKRKLAEVSNLLTRDFQTPIKNTKLPDINSLPVPEFPGLNVSYYTYKRKPMTFLITSRGCPYQCSFCTVNAIFGNTWRKREVCDICSEIKLRYSQGVRHFDIEDDNFTHDKKHCLEILHEIISMKLPVTFSAMNGLHYLSLDRELINQLWKTGFNTLNISLVSLDPNLVKSLNRPHSVSKFTSVLKDAQHTGISVIGYIILGLPGQTLAEMWKSIQYLAASKCLLGASPYYRTPGAGLSEVKNKNLRSASRESGFDSNFSARLTAMDIESDEFAREDIFTLFKLIRVINYIKSGIDLDIGPGMEYYAPAGKVLKKFKWSDNSNKSSSGPPFSTRIKELIRSDVLNIKGFKSGKMISTADIP